MPKKSKRDNLTIGFDEKAVSRIYGLRNERNERSLTIKDLSIRSGVSSTSIYDYESGRRNPTVDAYNKLAQILGWEKLQKQKSKKGKKIPKSYEATPIDCSDAPKLPKSVEFSFVEGHTYKIFSKESGSCRSKSGLGWDETCIFRYEGKIGIHHSFREIRGGWTRTYTDPQLIGKHIQEVQS